MSKIGILDDTEAALRVLLVLYKVKKPLGTQERYDKMKEFYNVGRRATDTGRYACMNLGLVEQKSKRIGRNPRPTLLHFLTEKGECAAKKLLELENILE